MKEEEKSKIEKGMITSLPKKKKSTGRESLTKAMQFDIDKVPEGQDMLHSFPMLGELKSFKAYPGTLRGELSRDMVVKYVVLMYSVDTILNQRPPLEVSAKKMKSATIAGFQRGKNGDFSKQVVDKLFRLKSDYVVDMILEFLKLQNNAVWTIICANEQMFYENIRILFDAVEDDKDKDVITAVKNKNFIRGYCDDIVEGLDNRYKEFFLDNDDVKKKVVNKARYTLENLAKGA